MEEDSPDFDDQVQVATLYVWELEVTLEYWRSGGMAEDSGVELEGEVSCVRFAPEGGWR